MSKSKNPKTQPKAVRTYIFDKRVGAVVGTMAAVLCVLGYFRNDIPTLSLSSANPQRVERNIPEGSILTPYNNGLCRLHAIDNATGHIQDDGLVNCLDATAQNTAMWKSLADQQKATEIRRSFRHD